GESVAAGARQEALDGDHERRDRGFHVRRATSVESAVAFAGLEGIARPFIERTRRNHVGMAGKDEGGARPAAVANQPEIADFAVAFGGAAETAGSEPVGAQLLAAGVLRGGRAAPDQAFAEAPDRLGGLRHAASGGCSRLS